MSDTVVYVATGAIDYEFDDRLGVLLDLDTAKQRCDETPATPFGDTDYDRHRIEEWSIGAREPARRWVRERGGDWESMR